MGYCVSRKTQSLYDLPMGSGVTMFLVPVNLPVLFIEAADPEKVPALHAHAD